MSHQWSVYWTRLPSNFKRLRFFNGESPKELNAIKALAAVGLISGKQMREIFGLDRKRLKTMTLEHKLVRHEMKKDKNAVTLYTLGANGAIMAGVEDSFKNNYWVAYKTEDILKRILFFQLYKQFQKTMLRVSVLPTPKPFIGAIELRGKPFYVYVVRGDTNDLTMFLKWNEQFNERVIVLTETLRHLEPLKWVLSNLPVRIALDCDLLQEQETEHIQNLFYFMEDGQYIKELVNP